MMIVLAAVMFVCLFIGTVNIFTQAGWEEVGTLLHLRLPRILAAAAVGAALAVCGVVLQGLLRNPLADPFILGISGGGTVGVVVAVAVGFEFAVFGFSTTNVCAFIGALGALALVLSFAKARAGFSTHIIILTGVVLNAIFSAVILFTMSVMSATDMHQVYQWLMGSLIYARTLGYAQVAAGAAIITAGSLLLLRFARGLNLFASGEESAVQMGVNVERTKVAVLVLCAVLTGVAVSITGPIGFVGLIVPHILRLIVGPDHRILLPASFFGGAIFLVLADTIARSILPLTGLSLSELPVGVVTAMCGGPFFLWLLRARSRRAIFG